MGLGLQSLKTVYGFDARVDDPEKVYLEITGACNLKCPHCPRTTSKKKRGNMPDALFKRAVEMLAKEFPRLPQLGFHFFGEIEVKKNFDELIAWARPLLPHTRFGISTTLTFPDPDISRRLLLCGFDAISVWPDGFSEESYAQLRTGGDYQTVKRNIRFLLEERKRLGKTNVQIDVGMVRNALNEGHVDEFVAEFAFVREHAGAQLVFVDSHDWAGQIASEHVIHSVRNYRFKLKTPCTMPFTNLVINSEGESSLCCFDMDMQLAVGNISASESLRAIWAGEQAVKIRASMRALDPPDLCKNCHSFYLDLTPAALRRRLLAKLHGRTWQSELPPSQLPAEQ